MKPEIAVGIHDSLDCCLQIPRSVHCHDRPLIPEDREQCSLNGCLRLRIDNLAPEDPFLRVPLRTSTLLSTA